MVEMVLKEIAKTVNGQFLSFNSENGQYYLDLKKDIDFDSLIEKRGEMLSNDQLDQYYFDALARVMECADQTHVTGYKIWEHEVEWRERKAGRSGYLFFGAPNERSTAQPPRDFYVYFLQPYEPPAFKDEKKADEVFLALKKPDDAFTAALRSYGGAREQVATASGSNKRIYEDKAGDHLKVLTNWLREKMSAAFRVTSQGRAKSLAEVIRGKVPPGSGHASVRDTVNIAASTLLVSHFEDIAPDYPIFSTLITKENRKQAAQDGLRWIAGSLKTKQATAVLDALELLDGDQLQPHQSRYAKHVIDLLNAKPQGQVLNRSELIHDEHGVDYWERFRLEPEFLTVVLASLVYSGDLVLSIPGSKIDASAIEQFARLSVDDLTALKHVERPKDLPLGPLQALFDLLGVPKGLIVNPSSREKAVQELLIEVAKRVERLVTTQAKLQGGLTFWGKPILSDAELDERKQKLAQNKEFLESLQAYNTPGKLKNFPYDNAAIQAQKDGLAVLKEVEELVSLVQDISPATSYIETAEAILPADHPWVQKVIEARCQLLTKLSSPKHRSDSGFQRSLGQTLAELRSGYKDEYIGLHQRCRLGANDDKKKAKLTTDAQMGQLQKLSGVEMMPTQQFKEFQDILFGLKTCFALTKDDIEASPICPHCSFRPVEEPFKGIGSHDVMAQLRERLDVLVNEWTKTLLDNLADPTVAENVDLVSNPKGKKAVKAFITSKELPDNLDATFIQALQEVLSGLLKVVLRQEDLRASLAKGGLPCTMDELEQRFGEYVKTLVKGKDPKKVRLVLE